MGFWGVKWVYGEVKWVCGEVKYIFFGFARRKENMGLKAKKMSLWGKKMSLWGVKYIYFLASRFSADYFFCSNFAVLSLCCVRKFKNKNPVARSSTSYSLRKVELPKTKLLLRFAQLL